MKKLGALLVLLALFAGGATLLFRHSRSRPVITAAAPKQIYVAMGDSVASGEGLPVPTDSSACDRSNQSYPNKVASSLKLELKSIACSGATLNKGILGAQSVNNLDVDPQIMQLAAIQNVKLVTITIGANDVGWVSMISKCYTAECGTQGDTAQLATKEAQLVLNLKKALDELKTQPKVIVSGYYQLVPISQQACDTLLGISERESLWLRAQADSLNKALQDAVVGYDFAKFAKPDFTGHELCTKEPWVQSLQDKAPFHPNEAGQNAVGQTIINIYSASL